MQPIPSPRLPAAVRALNRAGGLCRQLGFETVRLDEESLLRSARRNTGLRDFGDPGFRVGLRRLVASLNGEAELTTLGRVIARTELTGILENRLGMHDIRTQHPEIADVAVERPIFILGMPRTGTSILHELLAQDPDMRTPASWEVSMPCPAPETRTYDNDPRISRCDATLAQSDRLVPEFKKMHRMGARLPQECVSITAHEMKSMLFATTYRTPTYLRWLFDEADHAPVYAAHRRMLQHLAWKCPARSWALKSPAHLWTIDQLVAEYPDACVVQTHRDPLKVMASLTSLVTTLRTMAGSRVIAHEIGREWAEIIREGLERALVSRRRGLPEGVTVMDLHFDRFIADPIDSVRAVYSAFGRELSGVAADRMRAFLGANPSDKHGRHRYGFAASGLDENEQRELLRDYCEYFDVNGEPI